MPLTDWSVVDFAFKNCGKTVAKRYSYTIDSLQEVVITLFYSTNSVLSPTPRLTV